MGELTLRLRAAGQRPAIQGGFMAAAMTNPAGAVVYKFGQIFSLAAKITVLPLSLIHI